VSNSRLQLASPVTTVLDFGEGTKVRIGNLTVTLKGKFYRDDSTKIKEAETEAELHRKFLSDTDAMLNIMSHERYPFDAGRPLPVRLENLRKRHEDMTRMISSLGDKIAARDTTIAELKKNVDYLKKEFNVGVRKIRDEVLKCVMTNVDEQMEKPNVC
jgi:hypothetical protein